MTVSTTNANSSFTGNGSTTVFTYTYAVLTNSDGTIITGTTNVYLNNVLQATNLYTDAPNTNQQTSPGGTITFVTAPANGVNVNLVRSTPLTQTLAFPLQAKLSTPAFETALDKNTLENQESNYKIGTNINILSSPAGGAVPVMNAANTAISWISPVQAGLALIDSGPGLPPAYGAITSAAGGNVVGPVSSTSGHLVSFNSSNGRLIQDTGIVASHVYSSDNPPPNTSDHPFGDTSDWKEPGTSGSISGKFRTSGNWSLTGDVTIASWTEIYVGGTVNTNGHNITVTAGADGNAAPSSAVYWVGPGLGGGQGGQYAGGGAGGLHGGGGGASAGAAGGAGAGTYAGAGGLQYPSSIYMPGSAGGSGSGESVNAVGGGPAGGNGGGALYIEATGNVTIASSTTIAANGTAGGAATSSTSGAGGGAGGNIDIRTLGTLMVQASATINCNGGAGGVGYSTTIAAGGGGAGGRVNLAALGGVTQSGTITATAGAAGTGGSGTATVGGTGTVTTSSNFVGRRNC